MILDFKTDADHATRYAILDAETGRNLGAELPIVYADDQAGLLRCYRRIPGTRAFELDPSTGCPVIEELRRKIDIVPKR